MIDYQKQRERLTKMRKSLTRPHVSFTPSDAVELLDKAEKWDKVNQGLAVDGIHTSPGLLKELFQLREKAEEWDRAVDRLKLLEDFIGVVAKCSTGVFEPGYDYFCVMRDLKYSARKMLGMPKSELLFIEDPASVEEGKK